MDNKFKIENRYIGNDFPPVVIAEIGINHNGLLDLAIHLAENAIKSGAEIIKHQTHIADHEMSYEAKKIKPGNSNLNIFETIIHDGNKIIELKSGAMSYNERRPKKYSQIEDYFLLSEKNDRIAKIEDNPYFEVEKLIKKFTNSKLKDLKVDNFPSLPMTRDIISLAENLRNDKKI